VLTGKGSEISEALRSRNALHRLWRGDLPLAQAFWRWAILGALMINGLTTLLFFVLMAADQIIPALLAGYAVSVPYNIVTVVGVWRSAARYPGNRRWADLARIFVLGEMALLSIA
jgi:hypothetical protein